MSDWTGIVETELFADTYKNYAFATVRYPVLEVTATVEPYENEKGFSLRVLRAGKPRQHVLEIPSNKQSEWKRQEQFAARSGAFVH